MVINSKRAVIMIKRKSERNGPQGGILTTDPTVWIDLRGIKS